jgi:glycosyltransferase involved in cell wall biosynthesis
MKISVITVAFNSAKTVADTLTSVAMQTHPDIEHLIIDGASSDGTVEIVRMHASAQTRLISESDRGIYDAMNKGIALASGEVIGFLNSDDFYANASVLAKIADAFQDSAVDVCYGDLVYVSQDNSRVVRYWKSKPFAKGDFAKGWCPPHPTFFIRESALQRLGMFDLSFKLAADFEFMLRYLESGDIKSVYIPHVLVRMRLGGATNQSWSNVWKQNKEIFMAFEKNNTSISTLSFCAHKLLNRISQYVSARLGLSLWGQA